MSVGYTILNKKEKSGMKSMKLRVFSLKTERKSVFFFLTVLEFPMDWDETGINRADFLHVDFIPL